MAVVATQSMTIDGSALTYSAASGGGDRFTPNTRTFMHIKNGSGSSITATLVTPGNVDGLAIPDRAVVVPAGADRLVPLPASTYASADGLGDVTWSLATSVTVAIIFATP
jgi:hypothetical protein